ncbi:MAG: 3-oxoadipate enol-lactonase [Pseudorhodobacter sp.]|nr:3-oxoadipate enol-lactonase [Pseudorhodobacter sp.]
MPLIYLQDIRLNAQLTGPRGAPALVFAHALGTDHTIWSQVLNHLPHYQCLTYDQRGHGASDCPEPPYTMGALVRDAERLVDHFQLTNSVMIGVSLGGLVAQGLAVKRLDQVRALVLSNTAARIGTPEMWHQRIERIRLQGLETYADEAMQRILGPNCKTHPHLDYLRCLLTNTNPNGWIGCAAAIAGTDFYTTTASLRLPTLAIAGSNDGSTPPDLVRETADLIPGHRFALMRGVGHLPMFEKPAEYAALLESFLQDIGHR